MALTRVAVALENPYFWIFPITRAKNNAAVVDVYLSETKKAKLGPVRTEEYLLT